MSIILNGTTIQNIIVKDRSGNVLCSDVQIVKVGNTTVFTKEKTQEILQVLVNEPDNHYEWSEQDLYEHLRKQIKKQSNFLFTSPLGRTS